MKASKAPTQYVAHVVRSFIAVFFFLSFLFIFSLIFYFVLGMSMVPFSSFSKKYPLKNQGLQKLFGILNNVRVLFIF